MEPQHEVTLLQNSTGPSATSIQLHQSTAQPGSRSMHVLVLYLKLKTDGEIMSCLICKLDS